MKKSAKYIKDPFYKDTFDYFKYEKDVVDAGWFDDGFDNIDYKLNLLTTPLGNIIQYIEEDNYDNLPVAILLTTGGFAPIHQGHLDMMNLAKKHLENKGYCVAGGYFSTSHDDYVLSKYNSSINIAAESRIELINDFIDDYGWLMSDPWEALFAPGAVNFTIVVDRLEKYLQKHLHHLGIKFKLFYVFGSDNYDFHKAFIKKGNCICVERVGYERNSFKSKRMVYIKNKSFSSKLCSKDIRKLDYLIRDDVSIPSLDSSKFKEGISNIIKCYTDHNPVWIDIESQQKIVDEIEGPIINLDRVTTGGFKLDASRVFSISNAQKTPERIYANQNDVDKINSSDESYTVVDDDIASRYTIDVICDEILNCGIKDVISLSKEWYEKKFNKRYDISVYDIVDLRDFVIGAPYGGLVVDLPNGKLGRVPYIHPFVNLVSRAKFNKEIVMDVSRCIVTMNKDLYRDSNVSLNECDELFINYMEYQGFDGTSKLYDVISKWLINYEDCG